MERLPLSVVILARNEENNLRDCLGSVVGWADEVLVIDDGSTDKTREIAATMGARVLERRMDNEGRQRNWAYAQARNMWVLSLDADERVTEELKREIKDVLREGVQINGFTIPRRNFIGNYWVRYGGWYPSPQLKLFRKDKFRYEEAEVHPRAFMDGPCGHLQSDIIHYSYRSIEDFLHKLNNQTTREAKKWYNTGRKMSFLRALWRTIDRFFRRYLRKKGYRDGFYGVVVALFDSLYQIISYLKYKEMMLNERSRVSNKRKEI